MKKKILRYLICALTLLLQYNVQAQNWYYYGEEKIILEEKTNKNETTTKNRTRTVMHNI